MGHDFSDVRVHDDSAAAASASAVNAHAYTVGSNIVFQRDTYNPGSSEGRTTLAHELTHVVQQRSGPVEGTSAPGGIKVSDPSDRFEREASANAEQVMSAPAPVQTLSATGPAVQREAEEEDEVQGLFVQRHAGHDHEEEPVQGLFVQREGEAPEEEEEPVQGLLRPARGCRRGRGDAGLTAVARKGTRSDLFGPQRLHGRVRPGSWLRAPQSSRLGAWWALVTPLIGPTPPRP